MEMTYRGRDWAVYQVPPRDGLAFVREPVDSGPVVVYWAATGNPLEPVEGMALTPGCDGWVEENRLFLPSDGQARPGTYITADEPAGGLRLPDGRWLDRDAGWYESASGLSAIILPAGEDDGDAAADAPWPRLVVSV